MELPIVAAKEAKMAPRNTPSNNTPELNARIIPPKSKQKTFTKIHAKTYAKPNRAGCKPFV